MLLSQTLRRLDAVEQTRQRIENAHREGGLRAIDVERTYEALFLRSYVIFESYLEMLFFATITGKISYPVKVVKLKMPPADDTAARSIVLQGRKYVDWLPYKQTEERAKAWLVKGRPFSLLEQPDQHLLTTCSTIRNAIAHSGDHARHDFLKKVINSANVPARYKTPSRWLRQQTSLNRNETRFQAYLQGLAVCTKKLYPKAEARRELSM